MSQAVSILAVFLIVQLLNAQKGTDSLIQPEKNFAAYPVAPNTKEAFLQFLDSNGLIFENGKAVNGIDTSNKRDKHPGILNWFPLYAEISVSGDFGFTTGPRTFQQHALTDSVVARGLYTTVWHKNKRGERKFLMDLGCNNTPAARHNESLKIIRTNSSYKQGNEASLLRAEKNLIKATRHSLEESYKKFMSKTFCLLNRNNAEPAWSQFLFIKTIRSMPAEISYDITGSGISSSGDIGYVYGNIGVGNKSENYLRMWRKEKEVGKLQWR